MSDIVDNLMESGRRVIGLLGEGDAEMDGALAWCAGRIAEGADEIERLQSLLDGRDKFIVSNDLWFKFVDGLKENSE